MLTPDLLAVHVVNEGFERVISSVQPLKDDTTDCFTLGTLFVALSISMVSAA